MDQALKKYHTINLNGIPFIMVNTPEKGLEIAKKIIYESSSPKTALFLSGGSTPKPLYHQLAKEADLKVGAVAMVDERFGEPMHETSNERMIKETGFLDYLKYKDIRFYSVLEKDRDRAEVSKNYDETIRWLMYHFSKSIGILGMGADGHIAGIAPNRKDFNNPLFNREDEKLFIDSFNDELGSFKQRITMTFLALSMLDQIILLAFGKEKKKGLKKAIEDGSIEEIPARFLIRKNIAAKTLVISDQKI